LLKEVYIISMAIQKNPFRMAMIEQVDIMPNRKFEMMPKIGNTTIAFGNADDVEAKFAKLQLFYKNIITKCGWNYYSVVNLQYKNQVVAKRKGAEDFTADSLRTLELIKQIAFNAEIKATDSLLAMQQDNANNSTDVSLIQQSLQRDDSDNEQQLQPILPNVKVIHPLPTAVEKPISNKPIVVNNIKPIIKKPIATVKPLLPKLTPISKVVKQVVKKVVPVKPIAKPAVKPTIKSATKPVVKPNNDY
jgi:hypothetical protein